ncbi:dipeptidase D [Lishizhenia tianjinensis]|uniref:Cytosol non-specific dipeptidase n=1 Tax=Lishizhenia tianjinensis TaxID=477690 RepID=A0A1I6Y1P7_9FLAO|nr:aminoacyl-histidine dipeptidase [Lishizhenia tianjinensis]SFT44303.1 dipeptidase D [Lishizhenia tianjinensis]
MSVRELEPKAMWNNFADLNAVPRPSKKEERVIQFMLDFGKKLGLETTKDAIGNVIIKKPATPGMEDRQTIIMQSHVDMVHQKNSDTVFDFDTQGIEMIVDGDWVKANGTTLGADNGIGVATIMAVLESTDIAHPAIEAMFTVDEETGMTGAMQLDPSNFTGTILLNLDTEDDDELSIGCAGGIDTNTTYAYEEINTPAGSKAYKLELRGLMGGHSGMDIDKGRANANKLMNRVLHDSPVKLNIATIDGGSLRNAIPRESTVVLTIAEMDAEAFESYFEMKTEALIEEFSSIEKDTKFSITPTELPTKVVSGADTMNIIHAIHATHNGVFRMSPDIEGLVETSSSLARVIVNGGKFITQSLQRSSVESTKWDVANTIKSTFELLGAEVVQSGDYPGWQPNPNSKILNTMEQLYRDMFNAEPQVKACHAGLECGILGKHLPKTDMISFGPNIRHAHSPDETVQISSVQKFWNYLLETLKNIPA